MVIDREYRRKVLSDFTSDMMDKLDRNAHKDEMGWPSASRKFLLGELLSEVEKLVRALEAGDREAAIDDCVDIANYAMMIADNQRKESS